MSEQAAAPAAVDWTAVERRGRRWNWLGVLPLAGFFAAVVLLTGKYAFWEGSAAWVAISVFPVVVLALQLIKRASPRVRARSAEGLRMQYALRHHVDPGPGLRERTDVYARRMAGNGRLGWLLPFTPVGFLLQGRWDHPLLAVPSAFVVVAAVVALMLWWRRQTVAARQWWTDPPGPARDIAPPSRWERWIFGPRLGWVLIAIVVLAVVASLGAALLLRA